MILLERSVGRGYVGTLKLDRVIDYTRLDRYRSARSLLMCETLVVSYALCSSQ